MDIIFDLNKESTDWAIEINNELQASFPEFSTEQPTNFQRCFLQGVR